MGAFLAVSNRLDYLRAVVKSKMEIISYQTEKPVIYELFPQKFMNHELQKDNDYSLLDCLLAEDIKQDNIFTFNT